MFAKYGRFRRISIECGVLGLWYFWSQAVRSRLRDVCKESPVVLDLGADLSFPLAEDSASVDYHLSEAMHQATVLIVHDEAHKHVLTSRVSHLRGRTQVRARRESACWWPVVAMSPALAGSLFVFTFLHGLSLFASPPPLSLF